MSHTDLHVVALWQRTDGLRVLMCELSDGRTTLYNTLGTRIMGRSPWREAVNAALVKVGVS